MNIEEFFELSSGKWFSHRTSNNLDLKKSEGSKSEGGKSDIIIETLAAENPEVIALCEQHKVEPSNGNSSIRVTWNGTTEWDKEKHEGYSILVAVANTDNSSEGKLLRKMGYGEETSVAGTYKIGSDNALTLTVEYENIWSEERLWFASPNLRMRVATLKRSGGFSMASFTSEIRMGGKPSNAKMNDAATKTAS